MAQEDLAVIGQPDTAPVAFVDGDAQALLELAYRLGDRRLADMERVGRLLDAPLPRDLDKGFEMTELDGQAQNITYRLFLVPEISFYITKLKRHFL